MQKITPCLWFNDQAEEAAKFYISVFKNSKILGVARYGEAGAGVSGRPKGSVMTVSFRIDGQQFLALNGGPIFTFSPAISLIVNCDTQKEIDELGKLSAGFQSPEEIDDDDPPSYRIIELLPAYEKVKASAGPLIATHIGLDTMRKKCPHFNDWLTGMEKLAEIPKA